MKIKIETFGCSMNQADSEVMLGLLRERGLDGCDVFIINTCTVKTPTENKILRLLKRLEKEGRKVVVAGCLPPARKTLPKEFPRFSFIGVNSKDIVSAVAAAQEGQSYVNIVDSDEKSCLPRVRSNPLVGILPIAEGCLGSCSFCSTKIARGNLKSYPQDKLVREAKGMVAEGVREIWVTAQDTGAYGLEAGGSLPNLLGSLAGIKGDFRIRVGMMNPDHAARMLDELVDSYKDEKIYKFLHLPVQSGDDGVLKDMNRRYTVKDYAKIVDAFQKLNTTLSTDIIVGYPTEDEAAFNKTVELLKKTKPDIINLTRYWPRPGTSSSRLKEIRGSEVKRRSGVIAGLFKEVGLERNRGWIGWKGKALVSERNPDGSCTARNDRYKPIIVKGEGLLGRWVDVEVKKATNYDLRGAIE